MSSLFCCSDIKPYRPQYLSYETMFTTFMHWAAFPRQASPSGGDDVKVDLIDHPPSFAVQLVRQVNYGPLESKRYFIPVEGKANEFVEVLENDLIQANFQKLNSYKNYKCVAHTKFFEVNLYQKDPVNKHHWRANLARPASSIDL
ncbi:hypothetical protein BGZ61DRAFT_535409 [Ilyonectria robusta]|uniref:uncharacterized protein n=1 Tax=Ilyonectria robusta TaxID=1079257 RepID=UPI001E8E09DB|nr:uncharacterized protein BGZ61DRAFT_535409 [Ilyonectria robusta]KAH8680339.1 hypothetical protein BGZ61DRAFT_535409 [Ilyonectria robusta]